MAFEGNPEHLAKLKEGVVKWNDWRQNYPLVDPELAGANLQEFDLSGADLSFTDLSGALLFGADLCFANLTYACLVGANLRNADLGIVNLSEADLTEADLSYADLSESVLKKAEMEKAILDSADLENSILTEANIFKANLCNTNLSKADLSKSNLSEANLSNANLYGAFMTNADLSNTNLKGARMAYSDLESANLVEADLREADLSYAFMYGADLSEANLQLTTLLGANLIEAKLFNANLNNTTIYYSSFMEADLRDANFSNADLLKSDLTEATLFSTIFANTDLSGTEGLNSCIHQGPSIIDDKTLTKLSELPVEFLRGIGLQDWQIEDAKLLRPNLSNEEINDIIYRIYDLRAHQAIQISPLFISYNHSDAAFVDKVGELLTDKGVRFWRDIYHSTSGNLEKQVDRAMRLNDTVLLVLSKDSTDSDWVEYEVTKARKLEKEKRKDVLCPVALDDSWKTCNWSERLRLQIEKYNIMDFSGWQDENIFKRQFARLLDGLEIFYKKDDES